MDDGSSIPPWGGRRAQDALARVRAEGRRHSSPCVICDGRIDYRLVYPHPMSCSVQHLKARALFPRLTWVASNWAPAHLRCNQEAGTGGRRSRRSRTMDMGTVSQEW